MKEAGLGSYTNEVTNTSPPGKLAFVMVYGALMEPDSKNVFYGSNYGRRLSIKEYDLPKSKMGSCDGLI